MQSKFFKILIEKDSFFNSEILLFELPAEKAPSREQFLVNLNSGRSVSKYSGLLLVPSNRKDDFHSLHVRDHVIIDVPELHRADLSRVALDRAPPSQTARQAASCEASGSRSEHFDKIFVR